MVPRRVTLLARTDTPHREEGPRAGDRRSALPFLPVETLETLGSVESVESVGSVERIAQPVTWKKEGRLSRPVVERRLP
ncbi:hypothetical protein [Streptomyces sp. NL15-2K]|uniref:hypothetical protein n=1 Tax=Streptomyces sp. NL15-2K TaxID=376149 RepID=UPI000FFA5467|nr:hypothetical protein [Kutzneria buriramensis]WKX14927.1 hypothetical protein Q4V64_48500 [Kutzneria buriramensis]GCB51860.1 hypothetical protein SNL152K_9217 [Streptomyces sp. NL15-2K]